MSSLSHSLKDRGKPIDLLTLRAKASDPTLSMETWQVLRQVTFKRVFDAADSVGASVVIAGGAVVDFRRASDVDVFVMSDTGKPNFGEADALVLELGGVLAPIKDAELYIDGGQRGTFYRAGKAEPEWSPKPIHVVGWQANGGLTTPVRLLETFDLSIHAWAVNEHGRLIGCDNSTSLQQPISVIHDTPTTPERLVKLTKRYFLPLMEAARG